MLPTPNIATRSPFPDAAIRSFLRRRCTMALAGAVLGVFVAGPAQSADVPPEPAQISVSGKGEVAVVPDIAVLTAGVSREGRSPDEALTLASQVTAEVIAALETLGVEQRDIATRSVSLSPVYARESRVIRAWQAGSSLVVKLRNIESFGPVASRLAEIGISDIHGPSLQVGEPHLHRDAARRAAIADARQAAELLAAETGMVITGPRSISLSEGGNFAPAPYARMEMASMASADMPIAAGEQMVASHVQVIWNAVPQPHPGD